MICTTHIGPFEKPITESKPSPQLRFLDKKPDEPILFPPLNLINTHRISEERLSEEIGVASINMASSAMLLDPKPFPSAKYDSSDAGSASDDDLYGRLKSLQRQLEFIDIQEEYVKDELKNLKRELLRAQEEVKRIQSVPLVIGQFMEMVDQNNGIVGSTTGSNYYVRILSTINRELLKPSASVALHRHSNALVDVLPPEADSSISLFSQ
uniref:Proteasomal ATPase second OB domain-containing protein n=1 Tax=Kalanchoe fedtschenkoi TaxID=63787 RepID=A0A7N0VJ01_KALFE